MFTSNNGVANQIIYFLERQEKRQGDVFVATNNHPETRIVTRELIAQGFLQDISSFNDPKGSFFVWLK